MQKRISTYQALAIAIVLFSSSALYAEKADHVHRVTGLFQADRETDLATVLELVPGVELVSADYKTGTATLRYDAEELLPGKKPAEQVTQKLDQLVRQASRGSFQVYAPSGVDRKKLASEEIAIVGLDCKGCSYAAYLAVYELAGVENAIASFHDGKVVVWFDAKKIDRAMLEDALTESKVKLAETKTE